MWLLKQSNLPLIDRYTVIKFQYLSVEAVGSVTKNYFTGMNTSHALPFNHEFKSLVITKYYPTTKEHIFIDILMTKA